MTSSVLTQAHVENRQYALTLQLQGTLDNSLTAAELPTEPSARWLHVRALMATYIADFMPGSRQIFAATEHLRAYPMVWSENAFSCRMADIRESAIELHDDDTICLDGLNRFLREFDLGEYEPDVCGENGYTCEDDTCNVCFPGKTVTVIANITFTVRNGDSTYDTECDVQRYLNVEVSGPVDDIDLDSIEVDIDRVSAESQGY